MTLDDFTGHLPDVRAKNCHRAASNAFKRVGIDPSRVEVKFTTRDGKRFILASAVNNAGEIYDWAQDINYG